MTKEKHSNTACNFCLKPSNEVSTLIAGPGVYICDECVELCYKVIHDKNKSSETLSLESKQINNLVYPDDIYSHLNDYVIGQFLAKQILSIAVFKHYKRLANLDKEYKKENICLIGPTGCGKTLMVETIARFLNVPFASCTATSLTEAGYVGNDVEYVLQRLLKSADYDVEKAEKGIVFIDEIDKKARKTERAGATRDVSGEGVQQALLKMLEGDVINVPLQGNKKNPQSETVDINTKNILFIVGGAFVGIDKLIYSRLTENKTSIGFNAEIKNEKEIDPEILKNVEPIDLINFGMIPEFVGRIPVIAPLFELTTEELIRVLTEPKNSLVKQYKDFFSSENVQLEFTEEALKEIALEAKRKKIGARGLHSILEKILIPYEFKIKSLKNQKIVINREIVKNNLIYKSNETT